MNAQSLLEGRRFVGVVLECGASAGDAETLEFTKGRFHSSACDAYGYGDGAYRASPAGDGVAFEAETESAQYGQLQWRGVVRGPRLEGTLTMLRNGKKSGEKWVLAGEPAH